MTQASTLSLNTDQQAAADGFFQFLLSDEKEMVITGPGGVGKTFTVGHMADKVLPTYERSMKLLGQTPKYRQVIMTATTNKAAEVLGLDCGRQTGTLASFMNLSVQEDFSTGVSRLKKKNSWTVHQNLILFVDEASMVDTPLYNNTHEGTHDCKIVWIGDHCQLAPVTESKSPVFQKGLRTYELKQPMRTNIPELQALNLQMRETVETGIFKPIKVVPGIIDWFTGDQMLEVIKQKFSTQNTDDRILAYTNSRVVEYNNHVRDLRGLPSTFTAGERLINSSAIQLAKTMLSVEEEVTVLRVGSEVEPYWVTDYGGEAVHLNVYSMDIMTKLGRVYTDVKVPQDHAQFTLMLKWLTSHKDWATRARLKNQILDLRPRDASTVHKAQGSSLDTVIIDMANLSQIRNPDQAARALYVALSRARKRVIMYGELAQKFGGIIL